MVGLAQIKILPARARQARRQLGPDEGAEQGKSSAQQPDAQNQERSVHAEGDDIRIDKDTGATMPPMTIMVASNTPSNCRGLTGSKRISLPFVESNQTRRGKPLDLTAITLPQPHTIASRDKFELSYAKPCSRCRPVTCASTM